MTLHTIGAQPRTPSRRDIDIAVGILVGLHRYSEKDAFDELVRATHRTGGGITSVSRSLISLAGGRSEPASNQERALEIWGDLVHGIRAS